MILYLKRDDGWIRREWLPRCLVKVELGDQCQDVEGHGGVHWSYHTSGSLAWSRSNGTEETATANDLGPVKSWSGAEPYDAAGGICPPNHRDYVGPQVTWPSNCISRFTSSDVTDLEIVAKLEMGIVPEPDAGIDAGATYYRDAVRKRLEGGMCVCGKPVPLSRAAMSDGLTTFTCSDACAPRWRRMMPTYMQDGVWVWNRNDEVGVLLAAATAGRGDRRTIHRGGR